MNLSVNRPEKAEPSPILCKVSNLFETCSSISNHSKLSSVNISFATTAVLSVSWQGAETVPASASMPVQSSAATRLLQPAVPSKEVTPPPPANDNECQAVLRKLTRTWRQIQRAGQLLERTLALTHQDPVRGRYLIVGELLLKELMKSII